MSTKRTDPISDDLRQIEWEVDNYYKQNPLVNMRFAVAAWHFIAFCEDIAVFDLLKGHRQSVHDSAVFADWFVVHLKHPLAWLLTSCPQGGKPPFRYAEDCYAAANELSSLAENYDPFESAFTYASRGFIELQLQGTTIIPSSELLADCQYEAYDRLIEPTLIALDFETGNLVELIERSVQVSGDKFRYKLNPPFMKLAMEVLSPVLESQFTLPDHWRFSNYSVDHFRRVSKCLVTIAYIHFIARMFAASQGCIGLGYSNSIFVATQEELLRRLVRYSGVSEEVVLRLIEDLTYGGQGISKPDPAIQPLIKLNNRQYAIMPTLFISSSMERNFTVLLNKLPSEKAAYSRLVSDKESLMRRRIQKGISLPQARFFHGSICTEEDLPDIDLAIINDANKVCLLLELKWSIGPAEVREVIEKSEEIQKGVSQMIRLSEAVSETPQPFFDALGIDQSYQLSFAVATYNFIGLHLVQDPRIPVIRYAHLVRKIDSAGDLRQVIDWLSNRDYLPLEGTHYEVIINTWRVGKWGLQWHGIKPLVKEKFE